MTITLVNKRKYYIIYFNGLIHLMINKSEFLGIQSWREPTTPEDRARGFNEVKFTIEYYFKTRCITCEYDKIEKWETILKLIDQHVK